MVTILSKSTKPCFLCHSTEKTVTVKFKDGSFAGILCMDHVYERLAETLKTKKGSGKQDLPLTE